MNFPACLTDMPHAHSWSQRSLCMAIGSRECSSLSFLRILSMAVFLALERLSDAIHLLMSSALLETGNERLRRLNWDLAMGGKKDAIAVASGVGGLNGTGGGVED